MHMFSGKSGFEGEIAGMGAYAHQDGTYTVALQAGTVLCMPCLCASYNWVGRQRPLLTQGPHSGGTAKQYRLSRASFAGIEDIDRPSFDTMHSAEHTRLVRENPACCCSCGEAPGPRTMLRRGRQCSRRRCLQLRRYI